MSNEVRYIVTDDYYEMPTHALFTMNCMFGHSFSGFVQYFGISVFENGLKHQWAIIKFESTHSSSCRWCVVFSRFCINQAASLQWDSISLRRKIVNFFSGSISTCVDLYIYRRLQSVALKKTNFRLKSATFHRFSLFTQFPWLLCNISKIPSIKAINFNFNN